MLFQTPKASNQANLKLSKPRWKFIEPDLFRWTQPFKDMLLMSTGKESAYTRICETLQYGDGDAAWVTSLDPVLVAAYSGELDAVVLLKASPSWPGVSQSKRGQRLLTVNMYPLSKTRTHEFR